MHGKRPTAELLRGHDDFTAVGREHANGGFLQPGKSDIGDAAGEKSDAGPAPPHRRESRPDATEKKLVIDMRQKAVALGKPK